MKIYCPDCNAAVEAGDINIFDKIAKCGACNNVFSYAQHVSISEIQQQERVSIGKPKNFVVERSSYGLQIVRSWFTPMVIFLTFFCIVWNGFMAAWFITAIKSKQYFMVLFGSLHGVVGLGLFYGVLAGYINKTYIRISNGSINITHRPLPWLGRKNIPRQDLKQLYSKETIRQGKNGQYYRYYVEAITNKGENIRLIGNLDSSEEALFIEQEIEKYLKIEDQSVRGEIPR